MLQESRLAVKKDITLANDSILLRPYRKDDALATYTAVKESSKELSVWMPWCHDGYALKESEDWIKMCGAAWKKGTAYEFVILEAATGEHIGGCGLNRINYGDKTSNLGYWIRSSRTGPGVAPAAVLLLAHFGFRDLGLNRLEIIAAVENHRSQRVAEKSGAIREGILRNRIPLNDGVHDAVLFSLIPQDMGL
jgi:RimJ/RimL family protein N-acetyltransferase